MSKKESVICPNCGSQDVVAWAYNPNTTDGQALVVDCRDCDEINEEVLN